MCLSASALALFLNSIAAPITTAPGQIIVHAEVGDAVWQERGENWCSQAPEIDKQARFNANSGQDL